MTIETGYFAPYEGASIFYSHWQPDQPARALVLVVHGLAEHCLRYQRLAEHLNAQGYAVAALDLPGHGQSDGVPTFVNSFDDYVVAVRSFREKMSALYPELPVVLVGHSMGGLVSTLLVEQFPDEFAGLVLSGALIETAQQPSALLMLVVRVLSKLLPKLGVMQLDSNAVSRDPAVVATYLADPLNSIAKVPARTVAEMFAAMTLVKQNAAQLQLPLLLMHGGDDIMTAPSGTTALHQLASSSDKTLQVYAGLYHEIFNEPEWQQVYADLLAWLNQRF